MFDHIAVEAGGVTFYLPPDPSVLELFREKSTVLLKAFEDFYIEFGKYVDQGEEL